MSSLFSRRGRSGSNPAVRMPQSSRPSTPSASAAAAATQAFMKGQQSNAALSAAAAATALRSHPSSPVQVGDVNTKRMQRRGSTSSNGSGPSVGRPSSQLQRRSSGGSMTERTFRSPSPSRGTSPSRKVATVASDAPPMPSLPPTIPAIPPKSHRRAASLENQERISSPPPRPGGRGVSLDRANPALSASWNAGPSPLAKISELERESSQRSSINFSRPMSPANFPRPMSPSNTSSPQFAAQVRPKTQGGWFSGAAASGAKARETPFEHLDRPKTSAGLTPADVSGVQQAIESAADRQIPSKKKKRINAGVEGSRLASGTMHAKPTGTAVRPGEPPKPPPIQATQPPAVQAAVPSPGSTSADDRSPVNSSSETSPVGRQGRASGVLAKQPSIVREQPELEQQSDDTPSANTGRKIDASTIRSPTDVGRPASFATPAPVQPPTSQQRSTRAASEDLGRMDSVQMTVPGRHERGASTSPSRTPRFSLVPIELESGRRHQPPPRSVSPGKSALKHSPSSSVRTASPAPNMPTDRRLSLSPPRSQSPQQKKAARVSFDEGPATVFPGLESSKHAPANTKTKLVEEPDFEDVYAPRPALPSFGSIRGRKGAEEEPHTRSTAVDTPAAKPVESGPSSVSSSKTLVDPGHSRDYAIGGILAQDFANKTVAVEAHAEPEVQEPTASGNLPLPPEVTSVEGSGYVSDSDASAYDEEISATAEQPEVKMAIPDPPMSPQQKEIIAVLEPPPQTAAEPVPVQLATTAAHPSEPEVVPAIAVHPATPGVEAEEKTFIIPGAFPTGWESAVEVDKQVIPQAEATTAVSETVEAPSPRSSAAAPPAATIVSSTIQVPSIPHDDSESENESVYSDAAEDPSELYTSIDAILESPVSPPGLALTTDRPSPFGVSPSSPTPRADDKTMPTAAEWDDATTFWRGLSDQKKRQIEEQAGTQVNAEEETDEEPTVIERPPTPPKPKTTKKKAATATPQSAPAVDPAVAAAIRQAQAQSASRQSPEQRQSILKKSMRAQHERSFSDEGTHAMPMTLRGPKKGLESSKYAPSPPLPDARGALQKKHQPPSRPATSGGLPLAGAGPKARPATSGGLTKAPIPPSMQIRRRGSGDSDSSFKRNRNRPSTSAGEGISLRRTMRGPAPVQTSPPAKTKTTVRDEPEPASPPPHQMRMSLRQSVDAERPPSRGQEKQKKRRSALSPTRFRGFGRSSRDKAKAAVASASAATPAIPATVARKFKSRFGADSDDEDAPEQGPRTMESRFADSDEEVESPALRPVRGIPRKEDDVASELLPGEEDSDGDEVVRPPMPTEKEMEAATKVAMERLAAQGAISATASSTGVPGPILAAETLPSKEEEEKPKLNGLEASKYAPQAGEEVDRPSQKRRWSLFSRSRDRKGQRGSSAPPPPLPISPIPAPADDKAEARPSSPTSPILQRRNTPTGMPHLTEEDSWPLPPPPAIGGDDVDKDRPNTSDGVSRHPTGVRFTERPEMGKRRSTGDALGDGRRRLSRNYEPIVSQRTGKVKRFGRLRRALGLND